MEPNAAGLQFYDNVLTECARHGMEVMITIAHFDCPMHLIQTLGGWRSRAMIEHYLRLCKTLFLHFKGRVRYWLPFNEINMIPVSYTHLDVYKRQGHIGMKYSLASRELIADSVETMAKAHGFDGLVLVPNCDKIVPGMLMGALRVNVPSVVMSGGAMLPGND